MQLNPYINFSGNTEEAFNFYKSVFGGEFPMVMRYKDAPESEKVSPEHAEKIMHMALPIGGNVLMGTDALEAMGHKVTTGTNFQLSISADSREDADRIFKALSAGGKTTMPMGDTFWGSYFGMCTDKFGIQWMVDYDERFKQ